LRYATSRHPLLRQFREWAREADATILLVGGAVRDAALGRQWKDIDLTVAGGRDRLLQAIEDRYSTKGFRFRKRGITTWRVRLDGSDVDLVDATARGIDADLRRRDLTINAIGYDLLNEELLDPTGGLRDLRDKKLRAPASRVFDEDPLRALRLARFSAALPEFRVQREAVAAAIEVAPKLRRVSVERVREELNKMLSSIDPAIGLARLKSWGQLRPLLPELLPMTDCAAGKERPDVWEHTLLTIDASAKRSRLPSHSAVRSRDELAMVRWALLLHDISKPETFELRSDGRPTFHNHENLGAKRADALLQRLRAPNADRKRVTRLIRLHLRPGHLADSGASPRGLRRLAREAGDDLELLCLHAACDAYGSGGPDDRPRWRRLGAVLRELPRVADQLARLPGEPLLSGAEVMRYGKISAGPQVGDWMRQLATLRDDGEITTRRQAVEWLRRASADL
jgi:poly(A) polymerase